MSFVSITTRRMIGETENLQHVTDLMKRKYFPGLLALGAQHSVLVEVVLDAFEQAIHQRRAAQGQLVHHSDRGSQYLSIKYTERLVKAKIAPSVGSVGDSYDNALAETIRISLCPEDHLGTKRSSV